MVCWMKYSKLWHAFTKTNSLLIISIKIRMTLVKNCRQGCSKMYGIQPQNMYICFVSVFIFSFKWNACADDNRIKIRISLIRMKWWHDWMDRRKSNSDCRFWNEMDTKKSSKHKDTYCKYTGKFIQS